MNFFYIFNSIINKTYVCIVDILNTINKIFLDFILKKYKCLVLIINRHSDLMFVIECW